MDNLNNATEEVQLKSVKTLSHLLRYIKNPTEKVKEYYTFKMMQESKQL